jgi:hypothetical protein
MNKIEIRRISDAGAQVSYSVSTNARAGVFNPTASLFTYSFCPVNGTPCTFVVASTPTLP